MNFLDIKKIILLISALVLLSACGYKPSAKFARSVMGDKISTSTVISAMDPENTVIIKDAVDKAVIEVFQASLVSRSISDTHLILTMGNPTYSPIEYDLNGYIIGYRMSISLNIQSSKNGVIKNYNVRGYHDFSVAPNNVLITDQERFDAISFSTQRAIKSFLAQVSADGARAKK